MADQNITALPVAASPASSDQLLLVGATEEKLIDYDKLADAILTKLTSKQYTLDQGTKTLPAALNELNSNLPGIEFLTRTITAKSEKQAYDLQINVTEYMIISIWSEDRMGWQYTVTRGVSGTEATQNWAICFLGNPTGNFTFKVAVLKIK